MTQTGTPIADDRCNILPDYNKSLCEVYVEAAICLLQQYHSFDFLGYVIAPKTIELPSWVPDWTTQRRSGTALHHGHFRAAGETQMDIACDNEALVVKGLRVDQVGFHIGKSLLELANLTNDELYEGWMTNMMNYRGEFDAKYPSDDAYTKAIRWTLVAGRAVIARSRNLEDTSLRSVDFLQSWITSMIEFYRYIDEKYPSGCSYYEAICRTLIVARERSDSQFTEAIAHLSNSPLAKEVFGQFGDYVVPRSFYITKKGYIGLAPDNVRVGDTLAFFLGREYALYHSSKR